MRSNRKHKNFSFLKSSTKALFWFSAGASLGLFLFASFVFIFFQRIYQNVVYPGVMVNGINMEGKTKEEVRNFFAEKNTLFAETKFIFTYNENLSVTISAKELGLGYDETLLAEQAYSIGRSENVLSNITLVFQAYINGLSLPASYHYSEDVLEKFLKPISKQIKTDPVDALFTFENGKVSAFRLSSNGEDIDLAALHNSLYSKIFTVVTSSKPQTINILLPIKTIKPKVTTDDVNNFGIQEEIGVGRSLFHGSASNRVHNIKLASLRLNGILVAPNEIFSFDSALGDISAFTGYKQGYIIEGGRTVLGDGGGVCQVSTTLFRAILNAGLPIVERTAHAYRPIYYEQDSQPGFDATIYVPSVDLKFKNDTNNHILIQTSVDENTEQITFTLYSTKDGREIVISKPIISSQTPPPEPLYQDDPTLAKGTIKQVDFAAWGARVSFTRQVTKNGKVIISDKFVSNYRPWQAVYLRGTKE